MLSTGQIIYYLLICAQTLHSHCTFGICLLGFLLLLWREVSQSESHWSWSVFKCRSEAHQRKNLTEDAACGQLSCLPSFSLWSRAAEMEAVHRKLIPIRTQKLEIYYTLRFAAVFHIKSVEMLSKYFPEYQQCLQREIWRLKKSFFNIAVYFYVHTVDIQKISKVNLRWNWTDEIL